MINRKKPILTDTVKRFLSWNVLIFLVILLSFNIFIIFTTNFVLNRTLDTRLQHEMENILKTLEVRNDSLVLLSTKELEESDLKEVKESSFFLHIVDAEGNILIRSNNVEKLQQIPLDFSIQRNNYSFYNLDAGKDELRASYYRFQNPDGKFIANMQLCVFKAGTSLIIHDVLIFNLISLPIFFLIIYVASIFLVKKTLSPINEIVLTAEKISAQNLKQRIKYKANPSDEIGRLRDTLNNLFERLEFQVNQISHFTDHASHQLMNPLTIAKTELEYALRKERTPEDYKNSLELLKDQTENMIKIINHLLIISKHQDEQEVQKTIFNLSKLIVEETKNSINKASFSCKIEPEIYVRGNLEIFTIVIDNLVDNAIKYSQGSPEIGISLAKKDDKIELIVSDKGIGINDTDKEKIFERFFRTEKAEQLGIKGHGLGLSVIRSILIQLSGSISIEDNKPSGAKFIVRLPSIKFD